MIEIDNETKGRLYDNCPMPIVKTEEKALKYGRDAANMVKEGIKNKVNAIWLETSGCFGEVISLLNSENPEIPYILRDMINVTFLGSISGEQGENAIKTIYKTMESEFILLICGAIPTKSNGLYTRLGEYNGKIITATELVPQLADKAKHVICVGTCACYGGPTAGRPNLSQALSIPDYLEDKNIIRLPGCPTNPVWTVGTIGYLISRGVPKVDKDGRPVDFYGETIHDNCPRRRYFDNGIFATKLGEPECMYALGCRGPITNALCPINRWNGSDNWPVGDNTPCIGCAGPGFPDKTAPYVTYGGE